MASNKILNCLWETAVFRVLTTPFTARFLSNGRLVIDFVTTTFHACSVHAGPFRRRHTKVIRYQYTRYWWRRSTCIWCAVKTHKYSSGRVGPVNRSTFTGCSVVCKSVPSHKARLYRRPLPRTAIYNALAIALYATRWGTVACSTDWPSY